MSAQAQPTAVPRAIADGTVVVAGSINIDQRVTAARLPRPGETLIGTSASLAPGGKGANQAVAAARRGAATVMVGAVGDDGREADAVGVMAEAGVDLGRVATVSGPTGLALVSVGEDDAENTIIVVPGANGLVDATAIEAHADVVEAAAVLVLQGEIPVDGIDRAAALARGRVLLNLAPVCAVADETLRRADPLVVNEHEALVLLDQLAAGAADDGGGAGGESAAREVPAGRSDAALAQALRSAGARSIVLTLGAGGAVVAEGARLVHVASPRVDAVDTSGAGDAFVGSLAASLAAGSSLIDAVRLAVRVGAFAVTRQGTQSSSPMSDDVLPGGDEAVTELDAGATEDTEASRR
ncbi:MULTISPECIES: ribokinase [unclassified Microbacterium]|uniref:ribokinase n=1 Tax=unclassified Microbacterium TaxID=2609290 RepID=UPI00300FF81A